MNEKHTPGPWLIAEDLFICVDVGVGSYADICQVVGNFDAENIESGSAFANANLIAAAPDLLAALIDVLNRIDSSDEWWMDCPDRGGFDAESIRFIIDKARGEEK